MTEMPRIQSKKWTESRSWIKGFGLRFLEEEEEVRKYVSMYARCSFHGISYSILRKFLNANFMAWSGIGGEISKQKNKIIAMYKMNEEKN